MCSAPKSGFRCMVPPPPPYHPAASQPKLRMPLTKAEQATIRQAILHDLSARIQVMNTELQHILQHEVHPHWRTHQAISAVQPGNHTLTSIANQPAAEWVQQYGAQVTDLLGAARDLALKVGPTVRPSTDGLHYRPRRIAKMRTAHVRTISAITQAL